MWSAVRKRSFRKAEYEESSRRLNNPGCGWYHIHTFAAQKAPALPAEIEPEEELALVLIDIGAFRAEELSETALSHIRQIFDFFHENGKQMILRFAYDTAGKGPEREPGALSLVRRHMEQAGSVICDYTEDILVIQGIFVGSWGEMHGSKFLGREQMRELAAGLWRTTGESCCLAVRTPAQWREIAGTDRQLASRMGLFNDGLLSSGTDMGTYDMDGQGDERRSREAELDFQRELCTGVPNGGEVIADNPYNDFDNAVRDLSAMHITYLNQDYDKAVFDKWAAAEVSGQGCFDGLDGLSYIRRRLGYRLLITQTTAVRRLLQQRLDLTVSFRNAGFAPLYAAPELTLTVQKEDANTVLSYPAAHSLEDLPGGEDAGKIGTAQVSLPLEGLTEGVYRLYLNLQDPASGQPVLLANEQDREDSGYFLGTVTVR